MAEARDILLDMYCDLTWGQWMDLRDALRGELKTMNGARKLAMDSLIGDDLKATKLGEAVGKRAMAIEQGLFAPAVHLEFVNLNPGKAVRLLRKRNIRWVHSGHVKLLRAVYQMPELTYKHQARIFGFRTIDDLVNKLWISGDRVMGGQFCVTLYGFEILSICMEA